MNEELRVLLYYLDFGEALSTVNLDDEMCTSRSSRITRKERFLSAKERVTRHAGIFA